MKESKTTGNDFGSRIYSIVGGGGKRRDPKPVSNDPVQQDVAGMIESYNIRGREGGGVARLLMAEVVT